MFLNLVFIALMNFGCIVSIESNRRCLKLSCPNAYFVFKRAAQSTMILKFRHNRMFGLCACSSVNVTFKVLSTLWCHHNDPGDALDDVSTNIFVFNVKFLSIDFRPLVGDRESNEVSLIHPI